uniref:Dynein light intermediate chain n=1 Tax=Astyanax mexicanus TaxID=7994 RepID=W5KDS6_ASTMX
MATAGRSALLSGSLSGSSGAADSHNPEEDDGQNLWSSILSEVSTRSRSKLPTGKNVLVLGEVGSGKTTLVAKLQGVEEYMKGRGLEYLYFNVHDEDINAVKLPDICFSYISLQNCPSIKMIYVIDSDVYVEILLVKQFQEYVEPGSDMESVPQRRNPESEEESIVLPLGENTLTHNLGIPLVVVCTKCDAISTLEKEHDYRDEHLDFIQSHIRRFCLQYGASLLYTSMKENKNLDLLYKYLVHRLYGFPFNFPAQVVEKDSVFIPSGWDNEKKIAILHENFQSVKADDNFEDVIVKPPVRKFVHEKEIQAEDDQVFLVKLQTLLSKQPPVSAGRPVDASNRAPTGSPRTTNRSAAANVANVMPMQSGTKKIDPNMKGGQTSEGVLANFFNSLLTKKAGSPGPGGQPTGGGSNTPGTVRKSGSKLGLTDVQAELDRISNKSDLDSSANTPPAENDES